jgi:hypothetical protein
MNVQTNLWYIWINVSFLTLISKSSKKEEVMFMMPLGMRSEMHAGRQSSSKTEVVYKVKVKLSLCSAN